MAGEVFLDGLAVCFWRGKGKSEVDGVMRGRTWRMGKGGRYGTRRTRGRGIKWFEAIPTWGCYRGGVSVDNLTGGDEASSGQIDEPAGATCQSLLLQLQAKRVNLWPIIAWFGMVCRMGGCQGFTNHQSRMQSRCVSDFRLNLIWTSLCHSSLASKPSS